MQWTSESYGVTIEINEDDCSLCMNRPCVTSCDILFFSYSDGHAYPKLVEQCDGCGDCIDICPFMAISINKEGSLFG